MKELSSVMPGEDLLNGFQTSHMMHDGQLFEINLSSLDVSKSHKTSLQLARVRLTNSKIEENIAQKTQMLYLLHVFMHIHSFCFL